MQQNSDEVAINALLERRAEAIRSKNADQVLASATSEIVRYGLAPPLASRGDAARDRDELNAWFETWRGPIRYVLQDFSIQTAGDLAFANGFVLIGGTKKAGPSVEVWTRQTMCLRKRGTNWKIVHEHTSTPFYMDGSYKAAVDLTPPAAAMTSGTEAEPTSSALTLGGVIAYLTVDGAMKAADFYQRAFGAATVMAHPFDDRGRTMHVHLHINGSSVMLSDPYPEHGHPYKKAEGFNLTLQVDDIDARWRRACDAGAEPVLPPTDMFWGDRYGQLRDPFGVLWAMNQPKR